MRDFHVHSNYSDGSFIWAMLNAAEAAGLDGVGFADHCNVSSRSAPQATRARLGFNLDRTYDRRREGLAHYQEAREIDVYDAVEMDYHPRDEGAIAEFFEEAGFEYAIGSVHEVDGRNVQNPRAFRDAGDEALDALVDRYFDILVSLVESELFDVAAHPDLIERTEPLRGRATREQYRRATEAFADSRTIPEVNVGRALDEGIVHPDPEFLELLREYEVSVSVATDAHTPAELEERAGYVETFVADHGLDPVAPPSLSR